MMTENNRASTRARRRANIPQCPLRYGEPCTLCQAYVTGPEDCQTVALVMSDPDLKAEWARGRAEWMKQQRHAAATATTSRAGGADPQAGESSNGSSSTGLFVGHPRSW